MKTRISYKSKQVTTANHTQGKTRIIPQSNFKVFPTNNIDSNLPLFLDPVNQPANRSHEVDRRGRQAYQIWIGMPTK